MVSEALAIASPPRMPIPLALYPDKGICKGPWGMEEATLRRKMRLTLSYGTFKLRGRQQ